MESTSRVVMVLPTTPSVVSMRGAPLSTVTVSVRLDAELEVDATVWLRLRANASRTEVRKPVSGAVTLYGPGGRLSSG